MLPAQPFDKRRHFAIQVRQGFLGAAAIQIVDMPEFHVRQPLGKRALDHRPMLGFLHRHNVVGGTKIVYRRADGQSQVVVKGNSQLAERIVRADIGPALRGSGSKPRDCASQARPPPAACQLKRISAYRLR